MILALTPNINTVHRLTLYWGVMPVHLEEMLDIEDDMSQLEKYLKKNKWVKSGNNIVVISGSSREAGGTNSLRLHAIRK